MRGDLNHLTKVENKSLEALTKQVLGEWVFCFFSHNEGKYFVYIAQSSLMFSLLEGEIGLDVGDMSHDYSHFSALKIWRLLWRTKKKKVVQVPWACGHTFQDNSSQDEKYSGFLWARWRYGLRCCRSPRVLSLQILESLGAPRPVLLDIWNRQLHCPSSDNVPEWGHRASEFKWLAFIWFSMSFSPQRLKLVRVDTQKQVNWPRLSFLAPFGIKAYLKCQSLK